MKRLVAALVVALAGVPAPGASAVYAGHVRTAAATFKLRGVDGHVVTLALAVRGSGLGGTSAFNDLALTLTDCAGRRCTTRTYATSLLANNYSASDDLSVTKVYARLGDTAVYVAWSSAPGFGAVPPAPDTTSGAVLVTRRQATAVLLAGPVEKGGLMRYTRCADDRASVASSVGVTTEERAAPQWPLAAPAGLRVTPTSRLFTCA